VNYIDPADTVNAMTTDFLVRRERPHLVFNDEGGLLSLVNGVISGADGGVNGDRSFTLIQPIGVGGGGV
jgi:hypothetical protein